ncbi:uncharacterized protein LOC130281684 [Hyla sarda]|uniref:uncharacterized protein LOC130281684 n=1 Tax=Hyla sarda TaxID=327740 RepID=UPI0024C4039E|nr:uncharacterized protein LOC130281684 [Hyla sarda]
MTLQLHYTTLREYYKAARVPRGMRVHPKDCAYAMDMEYRNRFESITNQYCLELVLLQLEFLQKDLEITKIKVSELEASLKQHLTNEESIAFFDKQDNFLSKMRSGFKETKRHKWSRDTQDYSLSRVYLWTNTPFSFRRNRRTKEIFTKQGISNTQVLDPSSRDEQREPFLVIQGQSPDNKGGEDVNITEGVKTRNQNQNQNRNTAVAKSNPNNFNNRHKKKKA